MPLVAPVISIFFTSLFSAPEPYPLVLFAQSPAIAPTRELLHVFDGIALVHYLSAEQLFQRVFERDNACRLPVLILHEEQVFASPDEEVEQS